MVGACSSQHPAARTMRIGCSKRPGRSLTIFSQISTVDDTDVISNERLAIDHREWMKLYGEVQGDAYFKQEYFCEFSAPILGAVYADALKYMEAEQRICPLKIEPGTPVHTAWDLGVSDSTAIWFIQAIGRDYHLIDYYESSGAPLLHYVDVLNEKKFKYRWRYAQHWLPHDVKHRELNTAMSRIETLRSLGVDPEVVPAVGARKTSGMKLYGEV